MEHTLDEPKRRYNGYPWWSHPAAHLSKTGLVTSQTFVNAMAELYNPAQLDLLARANAIALERVRAIHERSGNGE
ncbi:hypothetical protein [Homoserinimonas hongtaonis]|uniref:Uncharacterized protein n=1 Tax=Homoserinimonas hongtaonis TaxID=2079791 RepID=A0A2U1SXT6_9MICO|nr:hypothetical protein [Salinibacterium hongtaonis]AWB88996.1 hypothetical protein C2138_05075 [Salinibacterium hongtaonis]PWB96444.1 hypothetical protein DF220_00230 [Salinibacterium hongtaonis]